ncbi:MAG: Methyltransferase [Candidatus Collierbacteria bacterium GW2011_GWB1_44_6]|uniref:Methyltransferase n=2 Tax=Candidatus Collieribacteriota TaxID=1752725 RepID=A0A0G1JQZ4_9BACT|nr:MAG: Methyltransferase [Candidatus Collierbacteria bacterium GW2011_GWC2_43_12]KKT73758.1 MAG: Methyltransferase [Candidatus Collierbacteria bacterium GW2011_GWB1_44_6]KKT83928.1 MAG: Methyltransferase [Microgenomates group bacterium GW2011_GWC1_44_9]
MVRLGDITQDHVEDFQLTNFSNDYRLKTLLNLVPVKQGAKILDVGSGNGEMAIALSKKANVVYATDNSMKVVKKLKSKAKNIHNLKVIKMDATKPNLTVNDFDLVTACDVAEHLKNDREFFNGCYFLLKSKGTLFVSVPACPLLYGKRDKHYGHYRRYEKKDLEEKITASGFTIKSSRFWNLIGVLPYLISEKILNKELTGPARSGKKRFMTRIVNSFLYIWLTIEGRINMLPIGLSLIVIAQKNVRKNNSN